VGDICVLEPLGDFDQESKEKEGRDGKKPEEILLALAALFPQ
jgi:hypothetical protein